MKTLMSLLLCLLPAFASATPDPVKRTEGLIAAFKAVKSAPAKGALSAADKAANKTAFTTLDGYFDQEAITAAPVQPHLSAFKGDELAEFKSVFWAALRLIAYPDSGVFFKEAKYTLKAGEKVGGDETVKMHAELEKEDIELDVIFFWRPSAAGLRLSDVSFDGARLTVDYQNQFGRIIKKNGTKGLIDALKKKRDAALKAQGN